MNEQAGRYHDTVPQWLYVLRYSLPHSYCRKLLKRMKKIELVPLVNPTDRQKQSSSEMVT